MIEVFKIRDTRGDGVLSWSGEIPRGLNGYDSCEYDVRWKSHLLDAETHVYDIQPQGWSSFFRELAESWRGWRGVKQHESLEHQIRLAATSDLTGHIRIEVVMRDSCNGQWSVQVSLVLEAGQLEAIALEASDYFGQWT